MRKILSLAMVFCVFAILAVGASAQLTVSDITLGGSGQNRGETVSGNLIVTNTGTAPLTITSITYTPEGKFSDVVKTKHNATFSAISNSPVAAGVQATISSITAVVPLNLDAIDTSFTETGFKVGTITITATDGTTPVTVTKNLVMQAKNELEFKRGKVKVQSEGTTETDKSFKDGSTVKDLRPGDKITLEVEIDNNFPTSRDREVDFDDISARITIDNSDFDVEDDEDSFGLAAGDTETARFNMRLEDDARDKKTPVDIVIEGVDENGARHGVKAKISIDVTRDAHDLIIRRVDMSPSRVTCGASRIVQTSVNLLNRGRLDEDEGAVEVRIPELSLSDKKTGINVNKDDTATAVVQLTVPENTKAGTYNVDVISMYDTSVKNNVRTATLTVDECKKTEPAPTQTQTIVVPPNVITQPTQGTQPPTAIVKPKTTNSFGDSSTYLVVLGVAIAVVVVLIIALLAVLMRRK